MKRLTLSPSAFIKLNTCLILTEIIISAFIIWHFVLSLTFLVEQSSFSTLLHFRVGKFMPKFYLIQDVLLFVGSLISLILKVNLNANKRLSVFKNNLLAKVIVAVSILSLVNMPTVLIAWSRERKLQKRAIRGLHQAISSYNSEPMYKVLLDRAQIVYKCCGIYSYKDWLSITWYKYDESPENNGHIPFSCCSDGLGTPCIHHYIFSKIQYKSERNVILKEMIWQDGCLSAITSAYRKALGHLRLLNLLINFLYVLQLLGNRIIQTADSSTIEEEEGVLRAYILTNDQIHCRLDKKIFRKLKILKKSSKAKRINSSDNENI